MKKVVIQFLFFLLMGQNCFPQEGILGTWLAATGNHPFTEKWAWAYETHYRTYDFLTNFNQFLTGTSFHYAISERNNYVAVGYTYLYADLYQNSKVIGNQQEHRIYQQFITRQKFGRLSVQHRYRIEERFIADFFRIRFRYQINLNVPLNHLSLIKNTVYWAAYNEIHLQTDHQIFNQDRLYSGFGFAFSSFLRLELGFMHQFFLQRDRNQLILSFSNTLPFFRKDKNKL